MSTEQELLDTFQEPSLIQDTIDDRVVVISEEIVEIEVEDKNDKEVEELNKPQVDEEDNNEAQKSNDTLPNNDRTDQVTPKPNRELKSILALSKEAKLDTNIAHKRKSIEPNGKQLEKSDLLLKRRSSTGSNSDSQKTDKKLTKAQTSELQSKQQKIPDAESPATISENEDNKETKEKDGSASKMSNKRKRDSLADVNIGGAADEHGKRNRKLSSNLIITMNDKQKDPFCWRCHHEGATVYCETCPRSFHQKCLKQNISQPNHWLCPECVTILKAENLKQRSPAMQDMSLEHLCGLLKFALKRMLQVGSCEPFIHPVSESEFPEYTSYIVQPMDLTCIEKNIKDNVYGSTQAFEADAKWILHNSIIFNSYQSKLTSIAKSIMKICKQEMAEIENCASCYLNANTKKKTWFIEVCPKPHLLVWAKLKGFPYWPAKAMRTNSQGFVDVRFFGAHDRAWVPYRECFLYSVKDPNSSKLKRNDINESVKELKVHIENLKKVYIEFHYAPYRQAFEPDEELKQLQSMLPRYDPDAKPKLVQRSSSRHSINGTTNSSDSESDSDNSNCDSETSDGKNVSKDELNESKKSIGSSGMEDEEMEVILGQENKTRVFLASKLEEVQSEQCDKTINISKNPSDQSLKSGESSESFSCTTVVEDIIISKPTVRGGNVRMRGGYTNTSGKIKVIPKLVSSENETKKRPSCDDFETPSKLSRRNSDLSVKSDSSRQSNISDKISKVDISENMEISLGGNDTSSSLNISENISLDKELLKPDLPDFGVDTKSKPIVKVNINASENAEFTLSPQSKSKSKIADRIMMKLTEPLEDTNSEAAKIETVKKQISDDLDDVSEKCFLNQNVEETDLLLEKCKNKGLTVLEKITELSPDMEIFETNTELEKNNKTESASSTTAINETDQQDNESSQEAKEVLIVEQKTKDKTEVLSTDHEESTNNSVELSSSDDEIPLSSDMYSKKESEVSPKTNNKKRDTKLLSETETEDDNKSDTAKDNIVTTTNEQVKILKLTTSSSSNCNRNPIEKKLKEADTSNKTSSEEEIIQTSTKKTEKTLATSENMQMTSPPSKSTAVQPVSFKSITTVQPVSLKECKKRKRSSGSDKSDDVVEITPPLQKKVIIVNVEDIIKNKDLENSNSSIDDNAQQTANAGSILENRLSTGKSTEVQGECTTEKDGVTAVEHGETVGNNLSSVQIKDEPMSEDDEYEPSDSEYMELKRKYLSALNIQEKLSDKPKQNEIRTRSKTDDKKFKVVDNLSKVIDDVATHYSAVHANEEIKLNTKRKEIFIKPLSKMQKQRARKSFPMPMATVKNVYPSMKKDTLKLSRSIATPIISTSTLRSTTSALAIAAKPHEPLNTGNLMFLTSSPAISNSLTILPPNQPITYTANMGNPMLTMVQHPIGNTLSNVFIQQTNLPAPPVTTSSSVVNHIETIVLESQESQNYIPQSGASCKNSTVSITSKPSITSSIENIISTVGCTLPTFAPITTHITSIATNTPNNTESSIRSNDLMDELQTLSSFVPESLTKAISEIMCRAPPKLKPRPPGPLSAHFDEGLPSTAGTVTSRINSISHRLGDYFRGMLVELLHEMADSSNPEAEITKLKLENEELKHRHAEEILEIKKNISSILRDIQKSIADDRNRLVDETRSTCETECLKRVEEAKSKQWCANCSKEAQFYCCWNTSYCDYPCQKKHWDKHITKCTQNIPSTQLQATSTSTSAKSPVQPLVLRPTTAPKFTKTLIAKPTKVFVSRSSNNKGGINVVRTTSGNHITLVEATPGNFELLGNGGPISVGAKFIANVGKFKSSNVLSVTSPSVSNSTATIGSLSKVSVPQTKQQPQTPLHQGTPKPSTTTTIVSDDEGD